MAEKLEDQVKGTEKQEKKQISILRSTFNEFLQMVRKVTQLGIAALAPVTQSIVAPELARDTAILSGVQVLGDATTNFKRGKKITAGEISKSLIIGAGISGPSHYAFEYINKISLDSLAGYAARGLAFGGLVAPAFIGLYQTVDYMVRNLSFKGLGKYLKDNYVPTLKTFWKKILPFSLLNIFFVPAYLQIPVAATLQYIFTLFGAPKKNDLKEDEKRDKTPYYVIAGRAMQKFFYNMSYLPLRAGQAINSFLGEVYRAPQKQPAPATAGRRA